MTTLLTALASVSLVIALGWAATRYRLVGEAHWPGFERVSYHFFFPAVVIDSLRKLDWANAPVLPLGGTLALSVLLASGFVLALRRPLQRRFAVDGPAFTSVFQGTVRWNSFVALAMASALYGPQGLGLAAIGVASLVPIVNVLTTFVLARHGSAPRRGAGSVLLTVLVNPFVWSSLVGASLGLARVSLPVPIEGALAMLGAGALAAGLLATGGNLDLGRLARLRAVVLVPTALKLVAFPLLVAAIALPAGLRGVDLAVAVLCAAMPTASAATIVARQLGGDHRLMAEITTAQTVLAALTMPFALALIRA